MNENNNNDGKSEQSIVPSIITADKAPDFIPPEIKKNDKPEALVLLEEIRSKLNGFDELKLYLESQIKDIRQENSTQLADVSKLYNALNQKYHEVLEKLNKEVNYRDKLSAEVAQRKAENDSIELKIALDKTHANIDASVETVKNELTSGLKKIQDREESISKELNSKLKEIKAVNSIIEENLSKFRKDMTDTSDREFTSLKTRGSAYLNENNKMIEELKTHSIDFLTQCQKQNETIIGKIPEQKVRFNKKDIIIYVISFLCAVSLIIQVFLSFR